MTADPDGRSPIGLADGDPTDQGGPPPMGRDAPSRAARGLETAELLRNPRARAKGAGRTPPRSDPAIAADTTLRERPTRIQAGELDGRTDALARDDAVATSQTMPSLPGRPSAHDVVTVPAFSARDLSVSADEIAARVRDRDRTPVFPLPSSEHYEHVRFLGEGGMGKVFLARDRRLGREVAIKFVRGDSRDHTLRLLGEARAQAQVNHDRVCKVYEVAEVDGQVFIAMQYIDGEPLGAIAATLTVEQKVMIIRDASEGVHAAHRVGIVHRDLNPNNIMVERDHDGRLRSYVMDFGLARDRKEGATETGTVMGTPHYMSPEQARGEVGRLDRRADIYSLGASLYVVLTGTQAIPGDNGLVVLQNIQLAEPRRLRAIDPDVPVDLEAITLRCLEKDRSARYDSARALAEDLGRFLDGEPVHARPADFWYRLRKRVRKHWRPLAAATIVVALLGAALGWGLHVRREGAERERLARRFTERVERIEASARYSALSPPHDIRADRRELQQRMRELATDVARAGSLARGPGHYALGRGALALNDRATARAELELAWRAGYREPRVAYALALVLGHQYQEALVDAERLESVEEREQRKRVLEQEFREPALGYLRQSVSAQMPSSEYVDALIAYYERDYDKALADLDAIGTGLPWFHEALELRGDIYFARAVQAQRAAQRTAARASFEAGRTAYAAAAAVGESVPELHTAQARLELAALELDMYDASDVEAQFTRGLAATARALAILPDHAPSLVIEAGLRRSMAEFRSARGGDVEDLLAHAISAGERAVAAEPDNAAAWLELSRGYWQASDDLFARNLDPVPQLAKAVAASDRVPTSDRGFEFFLCLGLTFNTWADYQDAIGEDSQANRSKAIDAYAHASQMAPGMAGALINVGANYYSRAIGPKASDADGDLAAAAAALDRALAINPRHAIARYYQGKAYEQIALHTWRRGGDPGPELARGLEHFRAGIAVNDALPHLYNGAGSILVDQATDAWERGGDPAPFFAEARASFNRAIAAAPEQVFGYNNRGEIDRRRGEQARATGDQPAAIAAVQAALAAYQEALVRSPDDTLPLANIARAHLILAGVALDRGRDPALELTATDVALTKVLSQNPEDTGARVTQAAVLALRAEGKARRGRAQPSDFAAAGAAFDAVLAEAPDPDFELEAAEFKRVTATWLARAGLDAAPARSRGLALVESLLATRPTWAAARALRGGLLLLQAEAAPTADQRRADARRAVDELTAALATNRHLEPGLRAGVARARQLTAAP